MKLFASVLNLITELEEKSVILCYTNNTSMVNQRALDGSDSHGTLWAVFSIWTLLMTWGCWRYKYFIHFYIYTTATITILSILIVILETWDKTCPAIVTAIRFKKKKHIVHVMVVNNRMYSTQLPPSIYHLIIIM